MKARLIMLFSIFITLFITSCGDDPKSTESADATDTQVKLLTDPTWTADAGELVPADTRIVEIRKFNLHGIGESRRVTYVNDQITDDETRQFKWSFTNQNQNLIYIIFDKGQEEYYQVLELSKNLFVVKSSTQDPYRFPDCKVTTLRFTPMK